MTHIRSTQHSGVALPGALPSFLPVLSLVVEALQRRQIRRSYGRLSEADLRDVGLTPHDLASALSLPLEMSAAEALERAVSGAGAKW